MQDCRVYKKGKLIKNGNDVKIQMGPLDEYEGIQVHVSSNGEKKIRLKYYIRIGRWNTIAIAYAYMDYDKNYIEVAYNPEELNEIFIKEFISFRKENNLTQDLFSKYYI